jgi:hypothetical protein
MKECLVSKERFAEELKLSEPDFNVLGKLFENLEQVTATSK